MDFSLTEAQNDLAGLTRRIVGDHVSQQSRDAHGTGGFDRTLWTTMARAGILDAALPSSVGGGGFGVLERCSVLIELGRAVAPVPYLSTIAAAASTLAEFGDGAVLERRLVPVIQGRQILAVVLPDAAAHTGFTVRPDGDGWRLSGAQTAVPSGAFADALLVQATGPEGEMSALVDARAPGLTASPQSVVDHADAALVEADDVAVETLLPAEATDTVRARMTVGLCATQLGVVERAVELTADYARQREQFGKPIGSFQAVRHRLADAHLDVEAVRLTLWQAAWRLSEGALAEAGRELATAKYWASEAGHRVAHAAVHVHGGVGIDTEHEVHRYFVAAKRNEFTLGGATAQLRSLGAALV